MGRPVKHWQIHAKNPEKAAEFYRAMFDWTIDTANRLGYRTVSTEKGGIGGGIWPAPPEGQAMVSLYVEVDDVARYASRAAELGGKVIMPPQMLPDGDEMAVILDSEGIPFGLMRSKTARRGK